MASNGIVWLVMKCAQIKLCSVQKSNIETAIKSVLELLSQKMGKSAGEKDTPCFELPMRTWTPRQSHSFNRQLCTLLIRILDLSKLCSKKELDWFVNFTPEGACGRSNLFKTVVLGKCKNMYRIRKETQVHFKRLKLNFLYRLCGLSHKTWIRR